MIEPMSFAMRASEYEALHGPGSVDKLKEENLEQWRMFVRMSPRQCQHCHYPLDIGDKLDTCCVCAAMEGALYARTYWLDLNRADQAKRRNAGLEG